jgi:hypothetical protein
MKGQPRAGLLCWISGFVLGASPTPNVNAEDSLETMKLYLNKSRYHMIVSNSYWMGSINFDVLHWIGFALQAGRETGEQEMQNGGGLASQMP